MRALYTFGFYLITPFILLRLYWRGRKAPAYRQRVGERFGFLPQFQASKRPIWVHAVSVGETMAALPLIKALLAQGHIVVVTCMTPTGSAQIHKALGERVFHVYAPYDLPSAIKRFLRHTQPKLVIIMETELWPNLLQITHQFNIPLLLANARLSAQSAKGYRKIQSLVTKMLNHFDRVAAQSEADGEHFKSLGLESARLTIVGNIKFDVALPEGIVQQGKALRQTWGLNRPAWIAASTHEGEEQQVLQAFKIVLEKIPDCLLIIVPRHPERFDAVAKLCRAAQLSLSRRSQMGAVNTSAQVFLGDTMGELLLFYAAADVAFVGGSLVPIGGHNLIEPAALSMPLITGPHLHNFRHVSQVFVEAGVCTVVDNTQQLAETVCDYLHNKTAALATGKRAQTVIEQNRGTLNRHLQLIEHLII